MSSKIYIRVEAFDAILELRIPKDADIHELAISFRVIATQLGHPPKSIDEILSSN